MILQTHCLSHKYVFPNFLCTEMFTNLLLCTESLILPVYVFIIERLRTFYGKRSTKTQHKLKQDRGGGQRGKALFNVTSGTFDMK